MSLAREINYAHATAPDLLEDFVIAQTSLLIRHVHFSDYAFKNRSGHVLGSVQSIAQQTSVTLPHGVQLFFHSSLGNSQSRGKIGVRHLIAFLCEVAA